MTAEAGRTSSARATALIFACSGVSLLVFWDCFAEDAFIVARYAANLVNGKGLTYNAIAWYCQPNPKPHLLPATIDGPCQTPQ